MGRTYASPAWWGFTGAADRDRLQSYLAKGIRAGFCPTDVRTFKQQCEAADDALFKQIQTCPNHVLRGLLKAGSADHDYNLRQRRHSYVLPNNLNSLLDSNFLNRVLYKNANILS